MNTKRIIFMIFVSGLIVFAAHSSLAMGNLHKTTPVQEQHTIYTCPMHPQIQQDHPGNCSICGMSLIKKDSKATAHKSPTCSCCGMKKDS